ncbi:MAG: hypothetical protein QOC99_655 [Acidobacteriota bacterium]|jgi:hypothetical protein|nr:hypothetical protein [Acidobacteriota bacterium]MDT7778143.1 hypothetical protein [Acidobacteriota bacterium]
MLPSGIMDIPKDLISAVEARKTLGVSTKKMAELLKDGTLRYFPNLLDRREKLVSKAEVLALIPQREIAA